MRKKTVKCGAAALIAIMGIASLSGCGNKEKVSDTKSTTEAEKSSPWKRNPPVEIRHTPLRDRDTKLPEERSSISG